MVRSLRLAQALGSVEARSITRDSLLRGLLVLPLGAALAGRLVLPLVIARIGASLGVDLSGFYPTLMSYVLLTLAPLLCGVIVGFLLLDQRDDGTLLALRVTPLPLGVYVGYRLAVPTIAGVLLTLLMFPLAGLHVNLAALLPAVLVSALLAPVTALSLGALAQNKVQGFALSKAASVLLAAPLAATFVTSGWRLLLGVAPTFWPAQGMTALQSGNSIGWLYLSVGLVYSITLIVVLLRRLKRTEGL